MARIRSKPQTASTTVRADLVEAVLKAIKDEDQTDGPVIFEVPYGSTDFIQVIVVWDRWSELPADARSHIVTEAYQRASSEQVPDVATLDWITTVIPVSVSQAAGDGGFALPCSEQCRSIDAELRGDPRLNQGRGCDPNGPWT